MKVVLHSLFFIQRDAYSKIYEIIFFYEIQNK